LLDPQNNFVGTLKIISNAVKILIFWFECSIKLLFWSISS